MSTTTPNLGLIKPDTTDFNDPTVYHNPSADILDAPPHQTLSTEYSSTTPAAPPAGIRLFSRRKGGRSLLGALGPIGSDVTLQPCIWANKIGLYLPAGNSNTLETVFGMVTPTVVGTRTARNVATTNFLTATRRMGFVSGSVAGNAAELYQASTQYFPSSTAGMGGLFFVVRFGISTASANTTKRMFIGLSTAVGAMAGGTSARTLTNIVGFSVEPGETTFRFITGGSAAPTGGGIVNLGATYPTNTASTDLYEARLFVPPGSLTWYYSLEKISASPSLVSGDNGSLAASAKPATGTLMAPHIFISNGATAVAEGIDIVSVYIETDN